MTLIECLREARKSHKDYGYLAGKHDMLLWEKVGGTPYIATNLNISCLRAKDWEFVK